MRTLRVRGDENMLPAAHGYKTLHSRNKSSPALSTMAANGANKLGIKRAAFGDVSNTVQGNRGIRDDSVISHKAGYEVGEKATTFHQERKAAALLRPAQRPLSVSGLKALLNNVASTGGTTNVKPEVQSIANTRKVLTKRNTTIFKDSTLPQTEQPLVDIKPLPVIAPIAPVHRDLNSRQNQASLEDQEANLYKLQNMLIPFIEKAQKVEIGVVNTTSSENNGVTRSDGAFIDDFGNVQVCEYTDETDYVDASTAVNDNTNTLLEDARRAENIARLHELVEKQVEKARPELVQPPTLPVVSEPEEYWAEEDDEDNYDEEGYVTARSYKSRGENTTGGATTILFPKVNKEVKKELAAAKALVESTRTADEIEDEAWDMSMVAEYGEEIFQYMKELEVYLVSAPSVAWS